MASIAVIVLGVSWLFQPFAENVKTEDLKDQARYLELAGRILGVSNNCDSNIGIIQNWPNGEIADIELYKISQCK